MQGIDPTYIAKLTQATEDMTNLLRAGSTYLQEKDTVSAMSHLSPHYTVHRSFLLP